MLTAGIVGVHFLMFPQIRRVETVIRHYGYSKVSPNAYNANEKEYFITESQEEQIGKQVEIRKRIQYKEGICTYFSSNDDAEVYFNRNGIHHFPVSFKLGDSSDVHMTSLELDNNIIICFVIDSKQGTNRAFIDVWDNTMILELETSLDDNCSIAMMIDILEKTGYSQYVLSFVDELQTYITD